MTNCDKCNRTGPNLHGCSECESLCRRLAAANLQNEDLQKKLADLMIRPLPDDYAKLTRQNDDLEKGIDRIMDDATRYRDECAAASRINREALELIESAMHSTLTADTWKQDKDEILGYLDKARSVLQKTSAPKTA